MFEREVITRLLQAVQFDNLTWVLAQMPTFGGLPCLNFWQAIRNS